MISTHTHAYCIFNFRIGKSSTPRALFVKTAYLPALVTMASYPSPTTSFCSPFWPVSIYYTLSCTYQCPHSHVYSHYYYSWFWLLSVSDHNNINSNCYIAKTAISTTVLNITCDVDQLQYIRYTKCASWSTLPLPLSRVRIHRWPHMCEKGKSDLTHSWLVVVTDNCRYHFCRRFTGQLFIIPLHNNNNP